VIGSDPRSTSSPSEPSPPSPARLGIGRFLVMAAAGIGLIALSLMLPLGALAELGSLPLHPLIVHGLVVGLPVVGIWLLLAVWRPAVLSRTFPALWGLSVVTAVGTVAAKSSGDSLSAAVGLPSAHAAAGQRMIPVAIAMAGIVLVLGFVTLVLPVRRLATAVGALGAVLAIAVMPLTYLAGHSGAEAAWEQRYAEAREPISRDPVTISMSEVRRHQTRDDCWAVVGDSVYDLTSFVARHPAGPGDITEMCGTDATEDFRGEHGGQREPESWLDTLRIGKVRE
jgi:hypothetical protein